jgi:chemosensory pili system protein ChpC
MSDALYVVMIEIADDTLMLPNAAVAEVTALDRFDPPDPGGPEWLAGWYSGNERRIPVVSFEAMRGKPRPEHNRRARVVLCNPVGTKLHGGTFAILAQGHPHLISLNKTAISAVPPRHDEVRELVLSRVLVSTQEAVIPDLEAVEARVAAASTQG